MLARLSIRTKITAVVAFLLVAMSGMGAAERSGTMHAINANTVDIATNWLPSVRALGDLRAGDHHLSQCRPRPPAGLRRGSEDKAQEKLLAELRSKWTDILDKARKVYEADDLPRPEERALYDELGAKSGPTI